jgi:hypothetical protein
MKTNVWLGGIALAGALAVAAPVMAQTNSGTNTSGGTMNSGAGNAQSGTQPHSTAEGKLPCTPEQKGSMGCSDSSAMAPGTDNNTPMSTPSESGAGAAGGGHGAGGGK